ncbi:uncharacterized protein [Spinacia oleracea]|uniref:Reverse transcriptase zinc-binding domain-containing protein n=1 Tax=Spinacia oleracea TaxID=3562 RepID=A0ABM3QPS3_SPIOL|nr:uncharacterized protein LOC130461330 [Spinacia oleracea]
MDRVISPINLAVKSNKQIAQSPESLPACWLRTQINAQRRAARMTTKSPTTVFSAASLVQPPYLLFISIRNSDLKDGLEWKWTLSWMRPLRPRDEQELPMLHELLQVVNLSPGDSDTLIWTPLKKGCFSVKSFSLELTKSDVICPQKSFASLWKGLVPYRVEIFVWLALQQKLNTKDKLCRFGIMDPSLMQAPHSRAISTPKQIWCPPPPSLFKWNVDASLKLTESKSAIEGVLRNHQVDFMCLFLSPIPFMEINHAETFSIYRALKISRSIEWIKQSRIIVESDSANAVLRCNDDNNGPWNLNFIINFIRCEMKTGQGIEITYKGRDTNMVADSLAKRGLTRHDEFIA